MSKYKVWYFCFDEGSELAFGTPWFSLWVGIPGKAINMSTLVWGFTFAWNLYFDSTVAWYTSQYDFVFRTITLQQIYQSKSLMSAYKQGIL